MRKYSRKKQNYTKLLFLGLLVILLIPLFLFFKNNLFNISSVEVEGDNLECTTFDQLKDSAELKGQNLIFLNTENAAKKINEKFICIKGLNFSKIFPNRVKVSVLGREGFAILSNINDVEASPSSSFETIATPSAEQALDSFIVDKEGVVYSADKGNLDIARIFVSDQKVTFGQRLSGSFIKKALEILEKVQIIGLDTKKSQIKDNFFVLFSVPRVVFRLDDEIDKQIASLQLILKIAKIDDISPEFIDLRFDKPIVKFAPKKIKTQN